MGVGAVLPVVAGDGAAGHERDDELAVRAATELERRHGYAPRGFMKATLFSLGDTSRWTYAAHFSRAARRSAR